MVNNKGDGSFSMNKEYITTFLAIVQCGSLSAAAKELYVDQSTISHRLKNLEEGLRVTLFSRNRGHRELVLTKDGERFYKQADRWLDLLEDMETLFLQNERIHLSVGSISSINMYLLQPFLTQLAKNEHRLLLEISNHSSEEIYRRLEKRELDIGFSFNPPHYKNLAAKPVFQEPMVLLLPYVNSIPQRVISPDELKRSNEIFFPWNNLEYREWHDSWWDRRESPYVTLSTSSLLSMFMTSEESWSVCPASMAEYLRSRHLVDFRFFTSPPPERRCYMLQKNKMKNESSEGINIFLNSFETYLMSHPWRYRGE